MWAVWDERYGKRYYHFVYKDTLFLVLDTEDNTAEAQWKLHEIRDEAIAAVDAEGWICVATLVNGGITAISPDGTEVEFYETGDPITTNICFGGDDLHTAYVTCSSSGQLVSFRWPRPGLRLAHQ